MIEGLSPGCYGSSTTVLLSAWLGTTEDREAWLLLLLSWGELCWPQLLCLRNKLQLLAASKLTVGKLATGKAGLRLSLRTGSKPAVKLSKWIGGGWLLLLLLLKLRWDAQLHLLLLLLECVGLELWWGTTAEGGEGSGSVLLLLLLLLLDRLESKLYGWRCRGGSWLLLLQLNSVGGHSTGREWLLHRTLLEVLGDSLWQRNSLGSCSLWNHCLR